MYLQSFVLPVCTFHFDDGAATIDQLIGSAFQISDGIFGTARHVLDQAEANRRSVNQRIGLVVKADNGRSPTSEIAPILWWESAPEPFDVAIGQTPYMGASPFRLSDASVEVWQDVALYGYPISAVGGNAANLRLNLRAHKGYIQRLTTGEDMPIGRHPNGIKVNFLVGAGASGSPLFIHRSDHHQVIGIAVASHRSEVVETSLVEVDGHGREYRERTVKVEEFGFAHSIADLRHWMPRGIKLFERSASNTHGAWS